jgi:hypothetical protein
MAHEIIKKSEKDTHDAREATKAAEKAAVGDLFSNAMSQEQGNTENVKR